MVLVSCVKNYCQTTAVGARSVSLSGVSVCLEDVWATANNPAGLGRYRHISLASSLEQRYLLKELGYYGVVLSMPTANGSFGLFSRFFGYEKFIDQEVNLAYGRLFGESFLCGLSLVYIIQKAADGSKALHQLSYQLGTIVDLSDKVKLGFTAFNPLQLYFKSAYYVTLPTILKLGMTFQYAPSLIFYVETEKDLDFSPILKLGMEYLFREVFVIRGGIKMFPAAGSFGVSFRHQSMLYEISTTYHQYLGFTPQLSLQYDFK